MGLPENQGNEGLHNQNNQFQNQSIQNSYKNIKSFIEIGQDLFLIEDVRFG